MEREEKERAVHKEEEGISLSEGVHSGSGSAAPTQGGSQLAVEPSPK